MSNPSASGRGLLGLLLVLAIAVMTSDGVLAAGEKKEEKRGGTVSGTLTSKGESFIEVKGDGEEKARKYVPHWVGGAPAQGGGPDKTMLKTIRALKVGSRVKVEWVFEERPRVIKVDVLKAPAGEEKKNEDAKEERKGKVSGTLTEKGKNFVEIKGDGEERARKYFLHSGGTKELLKTIHDTPIGARVQIDWLFAEHLRVISMAPVTKSKTEKD